MSTGSYWRNRAAPIIAEMIDHTTQPMTPITLHQVRQQDGSTLWRICLGSMCRETPDWWQVVVWLEQFRRLTEGEPEGDPG